MKFRKTLMLKTLNKESAKKPLTKPTTHKYLETKKRLYHVCTRKVKKNEQ